MPGPQPKGVSRPVNLFVGQPTASASLNITDYVPLETMTLEESGNYERSTLTFEFLDNVHSIGSNPFASFNNWIVDKGSVRLAQGADELFRGFIQQRKITIEGISRRIAVTATDISVLLDKTIVDPVVTRKNGESDRQRIQWLLATYGQAFVTAGSSDNSMIQTLQATMPDQKFSNLTLRQAIERVLGAASTSANYYIDPTGRLHTFDTSNPETFPAPYAINVTPLPSASEVAPEDLEIEFDSENLIDYYRIRGKNAAGTVPRSTATSIATYGLWQAFADAPDADTVAKGNAVGDAYLNDTNVPTPRGSFSVQGTSCVNASGDRWRSGQKVTITSAAHGVSATSYRITRLTTTWLSGLGVRKMEVEFGGNRRQVKSGNTIQNG